MKIVLTLQLQQNDGTPVVTGTETKANFVGSDYDLVRDFLINIKLHSFVRYCGWLADADLPAPAGNPTVNISNL